MTKVFNTCQLSERCVVCYKAAIISEISMKKQELVKGVV